MSDVVITPVESAQDRQAFLRFPETLYANDPNFVCPLRIERRDFFDPKKNPFFSNADAQLFLARKAGHVVGRVTAHVYHPHNRTHNEKTGFFGFFECEDDYATAKALWDTAASWLKERGMERMRGPANFTTNHEIAWVVDEFKAPPVFMMTYNPPCYLAFAEKYGMAKAMDFFAYLITDETPFDPRSTRLIERIRRRSGATIRSLDMSQFDAEVERVKSVYNSAWLPNWGFVPMDDAEFRHMAKELKQIVDPRIVLFAEVDGKPVGFSLSLPDINQALIKLDGRLFPTGLVKLLWLTKVQKVCTRIRAMVMGILPEYQKRGIDTLLHHETYVRGTAAGYNQGEMSWILESNTQMNAVANNLGARLYRTYRMYEISV